MLRADGIPAGPGLDVTSDSKTGAALLRAIGEVGQTPVEELQGRRLDANDFNRIVGVDVVRDILLWMHQGDASKGSPIEVPGGGGAHASKGIALEPRRLHTRPASAPQNQPGLESRGS